jgi:hypothetical protein
MEKRLKDDLRHGKMVKQHHKKVAKGGQKPEKMIHGNKVEILRSKQLDLMLKGNNKELHRGRHQS